jgi:hypothetical protein
MVWVNNFPGQIAAEPQNICSKSQLGEAAKVRSTEISEQMTVTQNF